MRWNRFPLATGSLESIKSRVRGNGGSPPESIRLGPPEDNGPEDSAREQEDSEIQARNRKPLSSLSKRIQSWPAHQPYNSDLHQSNLSRILVEGKRKELQKILSKRQRAGLKSRERRL